MTYDLLVRGGLVVTPDGPARLDVGVADGRIVALEPEADGSARDELDASGLHLLPGCLDAHVHLNEPGRTDWEGVGPGTTAMAAGGTTACLEMPLNAHPPTVDAEAFDRKRAAVEREARIDVGLWGGLVPGNVARLAELAERGVVGFKAFMCASGVDDFPRADDETLRAGMREAARLGLPVAVHAEDEELTARLVRRAQAEGRRGMRDFLASRPVAAELEAVGRALALAEETGCSVHVVHVSSGRGVALVAEARARGVDATCETCPHYLVLDEADAERLGAVAKCAPPLRPAGEREALWQALADGDVALVASDHSPSPPELKATDDAFAVWGGIAGAQTLLGLVLEEGLQVRGLAPALLADRLAGAPARRFGLASRKGRIAVGLDADLVLVDLAERPRLRVEDLRSRHRLSPFVGRRLGGRVVHVLVRGTAAVVDGVPTGHALGRLVIPDRRSLAS